MATDIDEQSLRLGIHLQSQDAVALIKGKQREDEQPPDVEFAAELYKFELQSLHSFYSDRALCRRLSGLGLEDGDPFRYRANEAQSAPSKPKTTAPERFVSARSGESFNPATGASASAVAKETTNETAREAIEKALKKAIKETTKKITKRSNGKAASLPSNKSLTLDTSASVKIVEETTASPAKP